MFGWAIKVEDPLKGKVRCEMKFQKKIFLTFVSLFLGLATGCGSQEDIDALGGRLKTIYDPKSNIDPLHELEMKYASRY